MTCIPSAWRTRGPSTALACNQIPDFATLVQHTGRPIIRHFCCQSVDPCRGLLQGLVFCVATVAGILKLYDARNYVQGPFATFTVRHQKANMGMQSDPFGVGSSRAGVCLTSETQPWL